MQYTSSAAFFTKEMNVCDAHAPLLKAVSRSFQAASDDEALKAVAFDRMRALWQNTLSGEYQEKIAKADPLLKHQLLKEQAAFNACTQTRAALYALLYPESELTQKELSANLAYHKAIELCR